MKRLLSIPMLLLLLVATALYSALAAAEEVRPILTVDSGGHKGVIQDLRVTADGRYLVSASEDKTIRVWDIQTKKEVRKIFGQVGAGSAGKIYALALSPDDRWLAVGGWTHKQCAGRCGDVRLYDFHTGELKKLLKSHTNVVIDLNFSADGRWLVSGSFDTTVKVWNATNGFRLERTLTGHTKPVYGVGVLPNGRVVSVATDNQTLLWEGNRIAAHHRNQHQLITLAINNRWIAVGSQNKNILLFDHELNLQRTLRNKTIPWSLAFSPNHRWLLAGLGFDFHTPNDVLTLYDTRNDFSVKTTFREIDNLTKAVTFLDDDTAISGGGSGNDIYFWDTATARVKGHIGGGQSVWAVGLDERGLAWGNTSRTGTTAKAHDSSLESHFDLKDFGVGPASGTPTRIRSRWDNWSLSHRKGGDYGFYSGNLIIEQNGTERASITRDGTSGYRHNTYGFTADGRIISGGMNGHLTAYDRSGQELGRFIGHTGEIWSIAVRKDWLVSGGVDQTIKLWSLKDLEAGKKKIYPALSLFADKDNEWVAWTESGYYAASANGDKYVGFHVNHGYDNAAEFFPATRFHDSLYRPDIVKLVWQTGSEAKAIAKAQENRKTETIKVAKLLPPRIVLESPKNRYVKTNSDTIDIAFCVEPNGPEPITGIDILLNGRPFTGRGLKITHKSARICDQRNVTLEAGYPRQNITILARNRHSSANPVVIEVERKAVDDLYKPNLYVLSIGVSDYEDTRYDLEFASIDAEAIAGTFRRQSRLFKNIRHRVLTDTEATKGNILDALDWIDQESTQRDLSVIFVAGHGVNDDRGGYYFLPHDANPERLRRTGVKWIEFQDVVTNLPGKVLLLADTCHSGNILGNKKRGIGSDITAAIKSITSEGTGQVIMTAATGSSASLEDAQWGHGAFTKALIEGIEGQADYDRDGVVYIKELDLFVTNRVKALTRGSQKPTTIIPESIPDFAVGLRMN